VDFPVTASELGPLRAASSPISSPATARSWIRRPSVSNDWRELRGETRYAPRRLKQYRAKSTKLESWRRPSLREAAKGFRKRRNITDCGWPG
jgi:hypothetical protein